MWHVWQVGAAALVRERAVLLQEVPHAVLGRRVHLPLRMVHPHVARPARLRLPRLRHREQVTGMAGVARGEAESGALRLQLPNFVLGLQADAMASAAALHALGERHRQPVRGRHGVHARPRQGVLAALELLRLDWMAIRARFQGRSPDESHVLRRTVPVAVTQGAVDARRAVPAQLPVRDDVRGGVAMTIDAGGNLGPGVPAAARGQEQHDRREAPGGNRAATAVWKKRHRP